MCQLLSQRPLPPARHQPHPLTPSTQTIVQEVKKKKEKKKDQLSANHIILPSPATQNKAKRGRLGTQAKRKQ